MCDLQNIWVAHDSDIAHVSDREVYVVKVNAVVIVEVIEIIIVVVVVVAAAAAAAAAAVSK